jgi:hypothetical protein
VLVIIPATGSAGPRLDDPDNFRDFKAIVIGDPSASELAVSLSGLGRADGEHLWLRISAVLTLPGARPSDAEWTSCFNNMIGYATDHGWVQGDEVRAHLD